MEKMYRGKHAALGWQGANAGKTKLEKQSRQLPTIKEIKEMKTDENLI